MSKKLEKVELIDKIVNQLFGKPDFAFEEGGKWKAYRSKNQTSVVMVREEEYDDRLLVIIRNYKGHPEFRETNYYAIDGGLYNNTTGEELEEKVMVDDVLDFYANEYKK